MFNSTIYKVHLFSYLSLSFQIMFLHFTPVPFLSTTELYIGLNTLPLIILTIQIVLKHLFPVSVQTHHHKSTLVLHLLTSVFLELAQSWSLSRCVNIPFNIYIQWKTEWRKQRIIKGSGQCHVAQQTSRHPNLLFFLLSHWVSWFPVKIMDFEAEFFNHNPLIKTSVIP